MKFDAATFLIGHRRLLLAAITLFFLVVTASTAFRVGVCYDEPYHLGLAYDTFHSSFRFEPYPLLPLTVALPYYWLHPRYPEGFIAAANQRTPDWDLPTQADFCQELLFRANAHLPLILWGRVIVLLLTAMLVPLCYWWGAELTGPAGGLGAALLTATCTPLIAHASLVSPDAMCALVITAAVYALARWVENSSIPNALAAGILVGLALLSKQIALLLLPIAGILFLLKGVSNAAAGVPLLPWARKALAGWAVWGGAVWLTLFAGFGGRGFFRQYAPSMFQSPWFKAHCLDGWFPLAAYLLPREFLIFSDFQMSLSTGAWPTYFLGSIHQGRVLWYYPVALLIKTPLAMLALTFLAAWHGFRRFFQSSTDHRQSTIPPALPVSILLFFLAFTFGAGRFLGVRYLLALYPLIAVWCAPLFAAAAQGGPWKKRLIGVAAVSLVVGAIIPFPFYLEDTNLASRAFGPAEYFFLDSNTDWGQGLPELTRWLSKNAPGETVKLSYFGMDDPTLYGFSFDLLPSLDVQPWVRESGKKELPCGGPGDLRPGLYAISASMLYGKFGRPACLEPFMKETPAARIGRSLIIFRWKS